MTSLTQTFVSNSKSEIESFAEEIGVQSTERDEYDALADGLAAGLFGGLPIKTNGALALIEILRRRNWKIDYRIFAAAIPHFTSEIRLPEARSSLQHLGVMTFERIIRGRDLSSMPVGSFVVGNNDIILFQVGSEAEKMQLIDPLTGHMTKIRRRKSYRCFIVESFEQASIDQHERSSWIGSMIYRFSPENKIILFLTFFSNALIVIASLSVGFIFDKVLPTLALDTLAALMVGVALLLYMDLRLKRTKAKIVAHVSGRLEYLVSSNLFEKLVSFPLGMLSATSVSDQINRLKQFETVRDFYAGPFVAVFFELPFVAFLLIVMFVLDPIIGSVLLFFILLYGLVGITFFASIKEASKRMSGLKVECQRLQEETIAQRHQIIVRGLSFIWIARMAPKFYALSSAKEKVEEIWRIINSLIAVLTPLAIGAVIFVGATRVISGELTAGTLIACTILSTRLLSPIQHALILAVRMPDLINLFRQINGMMKIQQAANMTTALAPTGLQRSIEAPPIAIEGLVMRYPRSVIPAIKGMNLQLQGGTFTCVTGPSGSGKSTLLRAIMGYYPPLSGTILVGTANINQLDQHTRADLIGYLGHSALQIHGTLAQNLRLSKPEATLAELQDVTDELGLRNVIEGFPNGFETRFTHNTRGLFSPAFKIKFAISQLLLKLPKLILLDEPESGLSNEDEEHVIAAIKRRSGAMTCLMVTHRPSLARQADQVLVLKSGQVEGFGSPREITKPEKK